MNPSTQQTDIQVYGSDATYREPPDEDQTRAGVVPLDTLPAAWWNWLWYTLTRNNNYSKASIEDLRTEMKNVIEGAGFTPTDTQTNQLLNAINKLRQTIATVSTAGSVISSSDIKSVSVNGSTGQMVVNALTDWSGTDTVKDYVDSKATDLQSNITAEENARKARDVSSVSTSLSGNTLTTTVTSTDGTTHSSTSSTVSAVEVRKSGADTNTLVAAVNGVQGRMESIVSGVSCSLSGTTLYVSVNGVQGSVNLSSLVPSSVNLATYARYLVNTTSPSGTNYVTADTSRNLTAHTLELT